MVRTMGRDARGRTTTLRDAIFANDRSFVRARIERSRADRETCTRRARDEDTAPPSGRSRWGR